MTQGSKPITNQEENTIPVHLQSDLASATGEARLRTWSKSSSLRQGLKWGGACWVIALAALPIPLVHFIVVPFSILVSPFITYLVYKLHFNTTDIVSGGGRCPVCRAAIKLQPQTAKWPIYLNCPGCAITVSILPSSKNQ